jgi:HEPN domain-containing protein
MSGNSFYKDWLQKAAEDELSLKAVLSEGAPSTACFLAQQMSEKFLKGLLVYGGNEFPKIHDLVKLGEMLQSAYPGIIDLKLDLQKLSQFYIETRYPADYPEFTKTEAREAYDMAQRIKLFVTSKLG